jgi:hypothetical protein
MKYHNGKFHILINEKLPTDGWQLQGWLLTATDPEVNWTAKKLSRSYYDPGMLFDNGKVYVAQGIGNISVCELDENFNFIKEVGVISDKDGLEGSHFYKRGDYYYIYDDANKGLALDLNTGKAINGGRIQFYIPNASNAQKWRFIQYPDGSVVIESAQDSRYVLDVPQSYASRGTRIHLYQYNGNSNQRWTLKKYTGQFRLDRNHRKDNYRPTPKPVVKPVEVSAGHGRK